MPIVEDLDAFLDDFGVPAQWNGIEATVLFDSPGELEQIDMQVSAEFTVRFKSAAWPGIGYGELDGAGWSAAAVGGAQPVIHDEAMTVDGKQYRVRLVRPLEDGAFSRAWLTAA
jgi:hypothetical protein